MKRSALLSLIILILACGLGSAQTTEFTYQGSLAVSAVPANGNYDFQFLLFANADGGTQLGSTVVRNNHAVANGIFTVKLDFGNNFPGVDRYLEIRVKPLAAPSYTTLTPWQMINSAPYSIKSLSSESINGLGPGDFIRNSLAAQPSSNFSISGQGAIGTNFYVGGNFTNNGKLGVGALFPVFKLQVEDPSNNGLRVQTNTLGGSVASFGGNGDFQVDATGIAGGRFMVKENGRVGIGVAEPEQVLHVVGNEILSTGFQGGFKFRNRGSVSPNDDWVWYSDNNLARFFRAGVGDLMAIKTNGDIGIGTNTPTSKLTVQGTIQSTSGGVKFPDGSVQTSASALGSTIYTTSQTDTLAMVGWHGSDTTVLHLNLPNGNYQLTATVKFANNANFFGQDNNRFFICRFTGDSGSGDAGYHYSETLAPLFSMTATFHTVVSITNGGADLICHAFFDSPTNVTVRQRRLTAIPITGTLVVQ